MLAVGNRLDRVENCVKHVKSRANKSGVEQTLRLKQSPETSVKQFKGNSYGTAFKLKNLQSGPGAGCF